MWCRRRQLRFPWTAKWSAAPNSSELGIHDRFSAYHLQYRIVHHDSYLEKLIVQGKVHGKRSVGRLQMRRLDQIRKPLQLSLRVAQMWNHRPLTSGWDIGTWSERARREEQLKVKSFTWILLTKRIRLIHYRDDCTQLKLTLKITFNCLLTQR